MGYHENSSTKHKRLEGMITIEYRPRIPLEQDLLIGLLLSIHMGNDIPQDDEGCGIKWCPIRDKLGETTCMVTKVTSRRTTRGHCRQEIPMGLYDRNRQRWTFKDKTKETSYLLKLATKGGNSSLSILNKIRTRTWNSAPPNSRSISKNQETVEESWQEIPDSPSSTPPSSPRNRPRDTPDWHKLICNGTRRPKRDEEGDTEPESELETSETEVRANPPPQDRENQWEVFKLLHVLHSDPQGQEATLRVWIQQILEKTRDQTPRKKATVSTHNLGPVGITLSMDVIEDTLVLGPYVTCFQDILLHGQDIHRIKRAIGEFNSDYQIFSDIGAHTQDDIRRTNYAGWRSSDMASLTMLHKGVFNIQQCTKHEWRSDKDRRSQLGRGRVLWIKATTIEGKKVNIINVYQATSENHEQQEKLYDTLAKDLGPTTDPCILIGDVNDSILGGRINYAPTHNRAERFLKFCFIITS